VEGTPLAGSQKVQTWEMVRMIATARILMPQSMVRLSAGRNEMNIEQQALCFMAGANSIFTGEKLLTTPNPDFSEDKKMFETLGLKPRESFKVEKKELVH
jgi:biotin synthase